MADNDRVVGISSTNGQQVEGTKVDIDVVSGNDVIKDDDGAFRNVYSSSVKPANN